MKNLLFISIIILLSNLVHSQDFAPIGAKWHYGYINFATVGFVNIESVSDTLINDINCRKLVTNREVYNYISQSYSSHGFGADYIYSDVNKVYIYRNGLFYTLYDFSAEVGETWIVPQSYDTEGYCDSTGLVEVIAKGDTIIENNNLRYAVVESANIEYGWSLNGLIIEKIGAAEHYFFPEQSCMIDFFEGDLFRCYEDDQLSLQVGEDNCDFIVGLDEMKPAASSNILITSTLNMISFHSINTEKLNSIHIFNISGKQIYHNSIQDQTHLWNHENIDKGIYFYLIEVNNRVERGKFFIK